MKEKKLSSGSYNKNFSGKKPGGASAKSSLTPAESLVRQERGKEKKTVLAALGLAFIFYAAIRILSLADLSDGQDRISYTAEDAGIFILCALALFVLFALIIISRKSFKAAEFSILLLPAFISSLGALRALPLSYTSSSPADNSLLFMSFIFIAGALLSGFFRSPLAALAAILAGETVNSAFSLAFSPLLCMLCAYLLLEATGKKASDKKYKSSMLACCAALILTLAFSLRCVYTVIAEKRVNFNFGKDCIILLPFIVLWFSFWIYLAVKKAEKASVKILYTMFSLMPLFSPLAFAFAGAFPVARACVFASVCSCAVCLFCVNLISPDGVTKELVQKFRDNPLLYILFLAYTAKSTAFMFVRLGLFRPY